MRGLAPALIAALALGGCQLVLGLEEGSPAGDAGPPNTNAALESLGVSRGALDPPFDPDVAAYTLTLGLGAEDLAVTPTAQVPDGVTIEVSEMAVASGAESPALPLNLGDNLVEVVVTPEDGEPRTYTIAANRGAGIVQQAYAKASNTNASDNFGQSVALDGDTLAIGAPREASAATEIDGNQTDNSAFQAGAVYVFVRSGSSWSQQAYIKASNAENGDNFGQSVALDGDTLAVGADLENSGATGVDGDETDNSANNAGAVYVFVRSGSSWSQQAYIKASNTEGGDLIGDDGDNFGHSVALDGDTLAVSAEREASAATGVGGDETNNSAEDAGAVYVFVRSGTSWSQQAYIKASNTDGFDDFGQSVALDGDTLAVGAHGEDSAATGVDGDGADNSANRAGAVYVFVRTGTSWSQQAYLKASNTDADDLFGQSVALDSDTLAVAAPGEASAATGVGGDETDNSADNGGAVYVFVRDGTSWSQQAYIKASNTEASDRFGQSVALDGDALAVGAQGEDSAATGVGGDETDNSASEGAGAVYLFVRNDTSWSQQAYLKASNTDAGDIFGRTVALDGDTLAVGAQGEDGAATLIDGDQTDNSAENAGAAYVFQ